uniref:Uncharacterized protein n=1 Tax=Ixodes scapularis TaxID=6945 RepID=A0A4D5RXW8_IXOSC
MAFFTSKRLSTAAFLLCVKGSFVNWRPKLCWLGFRAQIETVSTLTGTRSRRRCQKYCRKNSEIHSVKIPWNDGLSFTPRKASIWRQNKKNSTSSIGLVLMKYFDGICL